MTTSLHSRSMAKFIRRKKAEIRRKEQDPAVQAKRIAELLAQVQPLEKKS